MSEQIFTALRIKEQEEISVIIIITSTRHIWMYSYDVGAQIKVISLLDMTTCREMNIFTLRAG